MERALERLVIDAQALSSSPDEIKHTPSSVEFARHVAANKPLVIRNQGRRAKIPALESWTNGYLVEKMQNKRVAVAVSPDGRADSIINDTTFVEPASIDLTLEDFFGRLHSPSTVSNSQISQEPVYYVQSQNHNLGGGEFSPLLKDVGSEGPAFARQAFDAVPDATNIWIGDDRSVTSMHKDPYENIYLVVRGSKTFTILPPTAHYCLHEQMYAHAQYAFECSTSTFTLRHTEPPLKIPWIPVDPVAPDLSRFPRFAHARPITVTLQTGDMLYLPALWYHRVAQQVGPSPAVAASSSDPLEQVQATIAVNWWYDMRLDAPLWSHFQFVRRATMLLEGRQEEVEAEYAADDG